VFLILASIVLVSVFHSQVLAFLDVGSSVGSREATAPPPSSAGFAPHLVFPTHQSLGTLYVRPLNSSDADAWKELGEAQGTLNRPNDVAVRLEVHPDRMDMLDAFAALEPQALQSLVLPTTRVDDVLLAHLQHVRGLTEIHLHGPALGASDVALVQRVLPEALIQVHSTQRIAQESVEEAPGARQLDFPGPTSLGMLYIRAWRAPSGTSWRRLAPARGRVAVPAKHEVRLEVIDEVDLQPLEELDRRALDQVMLVSRTIDDAALIHVGALTGLRLLSIRSSAITDTGLARIQGLSQLRTLIIADAQITDAGLSALAGMTRLEEFQLHGAPIGDDGLAILAHWPQLQRLHLIRVPITNSALTHLRQLTSLCELVIEGTRISRQALMMLTYDLPDCDVQGI